MRHSTTLALLVAVVALLGSLAALAYTAVSDSDRIADIRRLVVELERARFENARRDCQQANRQAIAIRAFVTDLDPALRVRVAAAFPTRVCR